MKILFFIGLIYFSSVFAQDPCSTFDCKNCSSNANCVYCSDGSAKGLCISQNLTSYAVCSSSCSGSSCKDICDPPCDTGIFPCSENIIGQIMLILFYGFILSYGAKILSDGSELMLELFPKWGTVIGALLLPVLGAIPDAAIIIVSGALGSAEEAQSQVAIGVGTLAGSTIMLLTVPWAASMHLARCDMDEVGEAIDGKCTGFSLTKQGITVDQDTKINSRIMLITSISYFIVQGIAFAYLRDPDGVNAHKYERPFALVGFVVSVVLLIAYCVYQVFVPKLAEKRNQRLEEERLKRSMELRALHIVNRWMSAKKEATNKTKDEETPQPMSEDHAHAKALNIGLKWKKKAMDKASARNEESPLLVNEEKKQEEKDKEEEEGEEDPAKNFKKNMIKAILFLTIGTFVVAFFSDPMVDVLSDFSVKIGVKPFFVSFLITPYCSNASEMISSLVFAKKKKKENSSLVYSQLYGAATMNNTLCLGIFFALVAFRKLAWSFTAETLSILLVTWIVGFISCNRTNFRYYTAIIIAMLYPFSLFFVWFLESVVDWA